MPIKHIKGNLLDFPEGINIIAHCCNAQGVMGSGIALQIKEEYPAAYEVYRKSFEDKTLHLGSVTVATLSNGKKVANIVGQEKYGGDGRFVDYEAIYVGLEILRDGMLRAKSDGRKLILGVPYKMGCDRAGGEWTILLAMLEKLFGNEDLQLVVVELPAKQSK